MDEMTLTLNSPITTEQYDAIMDVDFDHTDRIWFNTKHGKTVEFVKASQWTPCSEGPPKKDGRYQVTRHDYVTNTEFVDILWYEKNLWWNRHSTGDYAVTAWMPLPEPYKAERREE